MKNYVRDLAIFDKSESIVNFLDSLLRFEEQEARTKNKQLIDTATQQLINNFRFFDMRKQIEHAVLPIVIHNYVSSTSISFKKLSGTKYQIGGKADRSKIV
eukprot:GHVR01149705.1.p1 GENE.GHVR01149705.1~~GHVR01149705.1.p1  ORF type:complete len:101 (+),score=9.28 GHVR01149705.1:480-782(+)